MGPKLAPKYSKDKPPNKRGHADNTPSPPDPAPDPTRKPSKHPMTSTLRPLAPKPRQQDPPTSRQSATFDASGYANYPTSYTQGLHAGDLSGAGPGYGQSDPTPTYTGRSALGASTQQPFRAPPISAFDRNAPPRQPRLTDWQAPSPPHAPGSSRSGQLAAPASSYAAGKTAKDPTHPRHKQRRTAPPPSLHADEKKAEDSPPATQSQSKAPEKENEDEVLIRLKKKYTPRGGGRIDWEKVSQEMKAHPFEHPFDRSANWCYKRWTETLDPTIKKAWTPDEDAKLKELKGDSPDWDWEAIASGMAKNGFYRQPVSFRNRWQDALNPKPSEKRERFSREEEAVLKALRRAGHTFREIADQFERRGWHRDHDTLFDTHHRLIEDELDEISV